MEWSQKTFEIIQTPQLATVTEIDADSKRFRIHVKTLTPKQLTFKLSIIND